MSEFKIKTSIELNDEKAKAQLKSLQTSAKENNIKLNVEMNTSSLNNLKQLETVLNKINALSAKTQNNLFGSKTNKGSSSGVNSLLSDYQKLINKKNTIEKQMSNTTNIQSYTELNGQLTRTINQITNLGSALDNLKGKTQVNDSAFDTMQRSLATTFQKAQADIEKMQNQISKLRQNKLLNNAQLDELDKLSSKLTRLSSTELKGLKFESMSKLLSDVQAVQNGISKFKLPNVNTNMATQFKTLQKDAAQLESRIAKLANSKYANSSQLNAMLNDLKKIQSLDFRNMNSSGMTAAITGLESMKNKVKEVEGAIKNTKLDVKFNMNLSKVISDLNKLRQKCLELGQSTAGIDKLEKELMQLNSMPLNQKVKELDAIKNKVSSMKSNFSGLGTSVKATNGFFSDLYGSMRTYTLGNMIGMQLATGVRNIKTTIVELDSALRDMMKVAPDNFEGTSEQLKNVKNSAIEAGISVARSSTDIIEGTSKALQTGIHNVNDAMEYAKKSAQFSNVSDLSQEDSNKYLTSIMSAYGGVANSLKPLRTELQGAGKDYNNLTKFSDLANYAGNNFAVTTGDVGAALQRSASVLAGFGTSMEDSIALVVGMQESTQNAEKTG